jgi:hypothetical protein
MGLDFVGSSAHWSYTGFHDFRVRLAREIEISLDNMAGFGGTESWDGLNDPIILLLNHSDCDGELTPEQCSVVAPRLRVLVGFWPDDYDRDNALRLVHGMEECAKEKRLLKFR